MNEESAAILNVVGDVLRERENAILFAVGDLLREKLAEIPSKEPAPDIAAALDRMASALAAQAEMLAQVLDRMNHEPAKRKLKIKHDGGGESIITEE